MTKIAPAGAAAWDAVAANYVAYAEDHTRLYAEDAWRLLEAPPGTRVLDVAAGTGTFTFAALAGGAQVLATDLSAAMVAVIDERLRARGLTARGEARVLDGQALALPDDGFDVGCSIFGVILFPDPAAGLDELVRVVRPGGRVALGVWTGRGSAMWALFTDALAALFPDRPAIGVPPAMAPFFSLDGTAAAMERAGLAELALHPLAYDWPVPDGAWLRAHAHPLFGFSAAWQALDESARGDATEWMAARIERDPTPPRSTAAIAIGRVPD